MIHGEFEPTVAGGHVHRRAARRASARRASTVERRRRHGRRSSIPLDRRVRQPGPARSRSASARCSQSLGAEREYQNDEQIDNSLRSVLFQVPKPGIADPSRLRGAGRQPGLLHGVAGPRRDRRPARPRPRDADATTTLRRAYGLAPKHVVHRRSPARATDRFPPIRDRPADPIDDPNILDFVAAARRRRQRRSRSGARTPQEDAVTGVRRTTLAARLKAIYGRRRQASTRSSAWSPSGTSRGTEFGELQLAIWKQQFEALRDGDRFFYLNDPALPADRAAVRHRLPAHPRRAHRAEHRRARCSRTSSRRRDPQARAGPAPSPGLPATRSTCRRASTPGRSSRAAAPRRCRPASRARRPAGSGSRPRRRTSRSSPSISSVPPPSMMR